MEQERKTVKIRCGVANGIELQLWKQGFDDGTGVKPTVVDGLPVRLKGPSGLRAGVGNTNLKDLIEVTEVDAEWWSKWLAQNAKNPMVEMGFIGPVEEKTPNPTP